MLKPGDRFGDYTVVRLLGKGGMGAVYLLENAEGGQVAAKILDPASSDDHESRKRFLREAELALGVKHPNLVETYDVGEDPDTGLCYILMEYVPGGSLADRLKAGPLPVNDAVRIVYQIASVLELARQKGIVHRDIKPDNIMFGADGKAKLADLGIARGGVGGTETTTVTQTGMMIGTPAYMSPEQMLNSHAVDTRADLYSLGIVFYEMLAGQRPNAGDTAIQLMAKAVAGEPIPDVRTLCPTLSASLAELVNLMCAMNADERVQTPVEVTTALSRIVHGHEVTFRRKAPKKVSARPGSGSRKDAVVWSVILVAVSVVAAIAYFLSKEGPPSVRPPVAGVPSRAIAVRPQVVQTNVIEKTVERVRVVTNDVGSSAKTLPVRSVEKSDDPSVLSARIGDYTWFYTLEDGKAVITRGGVTTGYDKNAKPAIEPQPVGTLVIPASIDGREVAVVGMRAFMNCRDLEKVVIPEGVRELRGWGTFYGCVRLKEVTLPSSLRKIFEWSVFMGCPIEELDLRNCEKADGRSFACMPRLRRFSVAPDNRNLSVVDGALYDRGEKKLIRWPQTSSTVRLVPGTVEIDMGSFLGVAASSVVLPPGVRRIPNLVFEECRWLVSVSLPASVESLGVGVFRNCTSLKRVSFAGDAPKLRNPSESILFKKTPEDLEVVVERGTRGWNGPGSSDLPEAWPVGDKNARRIRYSDGSGNSASDGSLGLDRSSAPGRTLRDQNAMDALFPGWSISGNRPQSASDGSLVAGSVLSYRGRANVFLTHPADDKAPAVFGRTLKLNQRHPVLLMEVASAAKDVDFLLTVKVNGHPVSAPRVICTPDMRPYERLAVPLTKWRGKQVKIEVEHSANGRYYEHAFWSKLEIAEGDGKEILGPVGITRKEVFPAANPKSMRWKKRGYWKYVIEEPTDGWKDLGFDDHKWKRTVKALGCDKKPLLMSVADPWRSDRIWIRRKFNWTGPTDIYKVDYDLCFDQDVEIYLNGREVLRRGGWNVDWVPTAGDANVFAEALRTGENVLAVTLKGVGSSYFDCGLSIETCSDKITDKGAR